MKRRNRDEHLFEPGPKRILSLDGGGIRGILSLQYLKTIEDLLRKRAGGDDNFRLCDYFDLIGGTSTGAIIAACLATGMQVSEIEDLYRRLGRQVFRHPIWRQGLVVAKFPTKPLEVALREAFGDCTLGDEKIRTGLLIMTKRLDTGSPWPLHNNPRGRYFGRRKGGKGLANGKFLLWQVVRASTAAPHYFEPENIRVSEDEGGAFVDGAFVDGGLSPANNPALQLLLLSTLKGYGFGWNLGRDALLLVSVGTGEQEMRLKAAKVVGMPAGQLALRSLLSLMNDAEQLVQLVLQWMSRSPTARQIDSEIGTLEQDLLGGIEALTYLRYDALLDTRWLKESLGLDTKEKEVQRLHAMDRVESLESLATVGKRAAAIQVKDEHFPPGFDAP